MTQKEVVVQKQGGVGFMGMLFLIFLTLKLTEVIDWSWWWVTAPLWAGFAFVLAIPLIGLIIFGFVYAIAFMMDQFSKLIRKFKKQQYIPKNRKRK